MSYSRSHRDRKYKQKRIVRTSKALGSGTLTVVAVSDQRRNNKQMATVAGTQFGTQSVVIGNPAIGIARIISDALDPVKAPSKGRSFADMTPEEREAMRKLYSK